MGVPLSKAEKALDEAVKILYASDRRIRSVGIGQHGSAYGFHVTRNAAQILPLSTGGDPPPTAIQNVPVTFHDRQTDIEPHVKISLSGPGSPGSPGLLPEQGRHNTLACGLQIANWDHDHRTGTLQGGHIVVGTLGCFVSLSNGKTALLSNNHVIAGVNQGEKGADHIVHPGSQTLAATDHVATLIDYIDIVSSPFDATPKAGTARFNEVDAGVAVLQSQVVYRQHYLSHHKVPALSGTVEPAVGDRVFKIGRTTGLRYGTITSITAVVGPILYPHGYSWFRRSITIRSVDGNPFSDHGDSGSIIVKEDTGEVIALLYAGNGVDTFACPIDAVLSTLHCSIP